MNRVFVAVSISLLLLLVACGESETVGKRVSVPQTSQQSTQEVSQPSSPITAAVVVDTVETGKTAAETLKEFQDNPTTQVVSGSKEGNFYPPITTDATGKDALKEKTRALFQQEIQDLNVDADDQFGARYHTSSGEVTNLPSEYSDSSAD